MRHVEDWDLICVGAGLTSLAFAAQVLHLRPATRILAIDRHTAAGGYATLFTRPKLDAYFDCSLHKISGTRIDGGNFFRLFRELQLENEVELVQHPDSFEACLPGEQIVLGNSPAEVERVLCQRFPEEAEAIAGFFREVDEHGRDSYYQHQIMDGSYGVDFRRLRYAHRQLKGITVAEALDQRFRDGYLKEILAAPTVYVGGFSEDMSYLYFLHVVFATLYKGNGYVTGSAQRLSDALAARIVAAGGQVQLGTAVRRIVPGNDGAPHVVETNRGRFQSRGVYLNAAPHHVLDELFDDTPELQPTRQRLESLRPNHATTTLYVVTDRDPAELGFGCIEVMLLGATQDHCVAARAAALASGHAADACEHAYWHTSPIEVTNYHGVNPDGGRVLCLNMLDRIDHWPLRRDKAYKVKKARATEVMLARLVAAKPALQGHVVSAELATPRTYLRYTNNTAGSGYGALVGTSASAHSFHHFFPHPGIHFLSAWVAGSGYEAAFVFAEVKAREWCEQRAAEDAIAAPVPTWAAGAAPVSSQCTADVSAGYITEVLTWD
ncbi:phytoene desaturase family protein [Cognatiluteimonas telluris]|uniref:phytoene desaturase family protein n=1 Tax=Cognatiluteimonas telluris TaxID=1104775 RepID=UPI001407C865|nr:FAD-dependent oxidoreductase [Lysobacter telluris]